MELLCVLAAVAYRLSLTFVILTAVAHRLSSSKSVAIGCRTKK